MGQLALVLYKSEKKIITRIFSRQLITLLRDVAKKGLDP